MTEPVRSHVEPPSDEAAFRAAVQVGVEQADAGLTVPFESVREWLLSWGSPEELPRPG